MCNKEKFWLNLCQLIGRSDLPENDKFCSFAVRLENRDELTEILDSALSDKSTDEWLALFGRKVPAAPLLSVEEALNHEFVNSSGRILSYETDKGASIRTLKPPVHTDEEFVAGAAPALGSHTDSLLDELGYSADTILELRKKRVVQ